MVDLSVLTFDNGATANLAAAALSALLGFTVLLYERFSRPARALGVATSLLAIVFFLFALSRATDGTAEADGWFRAAMAVDALLIPAIYALCLCLVGKRRRIMVAASWLIGIAFFTWCLASPTIFNGLADVRQLRLLTPAALSCLAFLGFLLGGLFAAVHELVDSARNSTHRTDRRRALILVAGLGFGVLAMADFVVSPPLFGGAGAMPFVVTVSVILFIYAALRYRAFAPMPAFATERVLQVMRDGVLLCDEEGRIRSANRAACTLLGAPTEMLRGMHVSSVLRTVRRTGDAEPVAEPFAFDVATHISDMELLLVAQDGSTVDVSLSTEPLRERDDVVGSVLVFRDIRERLRAARQLRSTEQRYHSLFWNNPSLVYEFDTAGTVLRANTAVERLLGMTADEVLGRSFSEFIHPDDLAHSFEVFGRVLAGGAEHYRLRLSGANGTTPEMKGVSVPVVKDGAVIGVFGVAIDITEEERVRRELELQRLEFAQLFEASPEAILVADEHDVITRVNPEFTRTFGYAPDEAIGRRVDDLLVPADLAAEGDALTEGARRGEIVRAETVRRRADGSLVDVSVLAREIRLPGQPPQLYGIYRDITEHRRAQQSLRERDEQLLHAQRLESIGKLAGGVAHDFNNLVTVINGHVRFALESLPSDTPARHDLEQVEQAGHRAANLTQQLLAFSRRQVLRPETVDAAAAIAGVRQMLDRIIGEHIRFETTHEGAAVVHADRGQLEQLLVNLVVNARDAMPGGGRLTISTDRVHLPDRESAAAGWDAEPGEYVRISVIDTGIGMDEATLARAFDPFFTTKEQGKGTGLGLATVFGIAKQSGGHVTADSRPGRGTAIRVWLPAADSAAPAGQEPDDGHAARTPAAARARGAGRILVVEDETALRHLAARILRRAGHDVVLACDGVEALAAAADARFDLVISDLVMPRMGGRELARRLRRSHPDLPVILMSGYDDEVAGGATTEPVLAKPFTPAELTLRVEEALSAACA